MLAPLRTTTASAPASDAGSSGRRPGSHAISSSPVAGRLTRRRTRIPSLARDLIRAPPISPDAPAITTVRVLMWPPCHAVDRLGTGC